MQALFDAMKAEAMPLGATLIARRANGTDVLQTGQSRRKVWLKAQPQLPLRRGGPRVSFEISSIHVSLARSGAAQGVRRAAGL